MKGLLIMLIILIIFALTPVLAYAQTGQQETEAAPLSQPLVREGTFAMKLAEDLGVGSPSNEAEAEDQLSAVGILPSNGWMADYPVTPDIIGELEAAVVAAADSGKVPMDRQAALEVFKAVLAEYKLDLAADGVAQPEQETGAPVYPNTAEMNNYYYETGPPVVTYYVPPPDYAYLYAWVSYPFWWTGFWYPGFFILGDFNIKVHGHHDYHHKQGYYHGHGKFVSNHYRDAATGRVSRINPAHRLRGGRAGAVAEWGGWKSPSARRGARTIFNRSRSVTSPGVHSGHSFGNGRVMTAPAPNRSAQGRTFSAPAKSIPRVPSGGRIYRSRNFNSGGHYADHSHGVRHEYAPRAAINTRSQSIMDRASGHWSSTFSAPARSFSAPPSGRTSGPFGGGIRGSRGGFNGGMGSFNGMGRGLGRGGRR